MRGGLSTTIAPLCLLARPALSWRGKREDVIDWLKLKIQLLCGDEIAMGPGKAALLEAIDAHGSIAAAGRALGMSYRRAWLLVDTINRCFSDRLVEAVPGGGRERGARLTEAGRAVLAAYEALEEQVAAAAHGRPLDELRTRVRTKPLPPHDAQR